MFMTPRSLDWQLCPQMTWNDCLTAFDVDMFLNSDLSINSVIVLNKMVDISYWNVIHPTQKSSFLSIRLFSMNSSVHSGKSSEFWMGFNPLIYGYAFRAWLCALCNGRVQPFVDNPFQSVELTDSVTDWKRGRVNWEKKKDDVSVFVKNILLHRRVTNYERILWRKKLHRMNFEPCGKYIFRIKVVWRCDTAAKLPEMKPWLWQLCSF